MLCELALEYRRARDLAGFDLIKDHFHVSLRERDHPVPCVNDGPRARLSVVFFPKRA